MGDRKFDLPIDGEDASLIDLFKKCDFDADGYLDWCDFTLAACDKRQLLTEFNLQEGFACFDFYQKNMITFDDLLRLYSRPDQYASPSVRQFWIDLMQDGIACFEDEEAMEEEDGDAEDGIIDYSLFKKILVDLTPLK